MTGSRNSSKTSCVASHSYNEISWKKEKKFILKIEEPGGNIYDLFRVCCEWHFLKVTSLLLGRITGEELSWLLEALSRVQPRCRAVNCEILPFKTEVVFRDARFTKWLGLWKFWCLQSSCWTFFSFPPVSKSNVQTQLAATKCSYLNYRFTCQC